MKKLIFTTIYSSVLASVLWINLDGMCLLDACRAKKRDQVSFPGVTKINNGVHVGTVEDGFHVAMERVDKDNIREWVEYARSQFRRFPQAKSKSLSDNNGIMNFRDLLVRYEQLITHGIVCETTIKSTDEIWVAYASNKPVTGRADLKNHSNIEMFFAVVTSPEARMTSHIGISRTVEAAIDLEKTPPARKRHLDQSIHLHSFAAKVMKLKNNARKYMLTVPLATMRNIMIAKMPKGSVSFGDNLLQKRIEELKEKEEKNPKSLLSFCREKLKKREDETTMGYEERIIKVIEKGIESIPWPWTSLNDFYDCEILLPLLKSNPPRIIRNDDGCEMKEFIIKNSDGTVFETFNKLSSNYIIHGPSLYQRLFINNAPSSCQWVFYIRPNSSWQYTLIDLDVLAEVKTLERQVE